MPKYGTLSRIRANLIHIPFIKTVEKEDTIPQNDEEKIVKIKRMYCKFCDYSSLNPGNLEKHRTTLHPEQKSDKMETEEQISSHIEEKYQGNTCNICSKTFAHLR